MEIKQTKNKGLFYSFDITVKKDEFEKIVAEKLADIATKAKLPGFRPGKAPMKVIEQKYMENARAEAADKLVGEGAFKAFAEQKLRLANQPKVEIKTFETGKDFVFSASGEVLPEVKEVDLSKIKAEKPTAEVTEKEIDEALNRLAKGHQKTEIITTKRKTKKGDIIVIDFVGTIDGKEFRGGTGKDYYLELGSNTFIPGFEDQLTGKNIGEEVIVDTTFPEQYHAKEMAGKHALFKTTIKELRQKVDAEINDDFAKNFGQKDLAELKNLIKDELTKEYNNVSRIHTKKNILDALEKVCDFEVPQSMVDQEFAAIWAQMEQAKKSGQIDEEDKGKTDAQLKKEYTKIAERRIKLGLLLAEIANKNQIKVDDNDINKALFEEARRYPGQEDKVFDFYNKHPGAIEQLKAPLFEEKVIDFIMTKANLTEKKLAVKDLYEYK